MKNETTAVVLVVVVLAVQFVEFAPQGQASTITLTTSSASNSYAKCNLAGPAGFVRVQGPQTITASGCLRAFGGEEIDGDYLNTTWNAPPLYLDVRVEGRAPLNVTVVIDHEPLPTIWQRNDTTIVTLNNLGPISLFEEFLVGVINDASTNNTVSIAISFTGQQGYVQEQNSTSSAGGAPEFSTQTLAGIVFVVVVVVLVVVLNISRNRRQ